MIDPALNARVIALDLALAAAELDGIVETVPSYRSLLIYYDPLEMSFHRLVTELQRLLARGLRTLGTPSVTWNVPVSYEQPHADDLPEVSRRLGLSEEQVIALHTGAEYRVYTLGFVPGFPYLGGMPAALAISRREVPRQQVPPGAVAIGGVQAAIFPIKMPTGWYVVGQTPLRPFDMHRQDPFLFRPGDRVRFRRVDPAAYRHLSRLRSHELLPLVRVVE